MKITRLYLPTSAEAASDLSHLAPGVLVFAMLTLQPADSVRTVSDYVYSLDAVEIRAEVAKHRAHRCRKLFRVLEPASSRHVAVQELDPRTFLPLDFVGTPLKDGWTPLTMPGYIVLSLDDVRVLREALESHASLSGNEAVPSHCASFARIGFAVSPAGEIQISSCDLRRAARDKAEGL